MIMEPTQQRKILHTTISQQAFDSLEEIRVNNGFSSISSALEHLISNNNIKRQLTLIFEALTKLKRVTDLPTGVFKGSDLKVVKDY